MSHPKANAKAIFLEALDHKDPSELLRFLDQSCGADPALRARVEDLLFAHRDAGNFLGRPDRPEVTSDVPLAERPGTVIGPYKLLEQIGPLSPCTPDRGRWPLDCGSTPLPQAA